MKKLIAVITAVSLLAAVGCSGTSKETKLEQIKKAGKITMYTNAEFPPYEFMENGEIIGVDVEIGKAIAEKIGVELEIANAEFGGIVASISSGKGDMAITGLTINEERKQSVDFSVPYVDSLQYLIVPMDTDIEVMENLENKIVGVQTGTTGDMLVEGEIEGGVLEGKNVEIKQYNSAPIAMQDLIANRISAVVIDELVAIAIANQNPGYKAIPFMYESGAPVTEQFGVAIAKGNEDLLAVIDEVVSDMVSKGLINQYIEQYTY